MVVSKFILLHLSLHSLKEGSWQYSSYLKISMPSEYSIFNTYKFHHFWNETWVSSETQASHRWCIAIPIDSVACSILCLCTNSVPSGNVIKYSTIESYNSFIQPHESRIFLPYQMLAKYCDNWRSEGNISKHLISCIFSAWMFLVSRDLLIFAY